MSQIKYWKKRSDDDFDNLDVTLIETNGGLYMMDECDAYGSGVLTVYLDKNHKGNPRCHSLVRQKAQIYNRQTLELIKTDCVPRFSSVKADFRKEIPQTLNLRIPLENGFAGVIDYLRQGGVIL